MDFYCQKVSLPFLWVFNDLKANVLIIKCFILSYCLLGLVKLACIAILPHRPSSPVYLYRVAVVSVFCYNNISPVAAIAAIAASAFVRVFVGEVILASGLVVVIKAKEEVIVVISAIISSIIIVVF